jgi:hypothetical protein
MSLLTIVLSGTARAWSCEGTGCNPCPMADGDQLTYHINTNDFTTTQAAAVEDGANAWDAGPTRVLRDADWDFIRGSDTGSDGFTGNGTNNVRMKPDTWFDETGTLGTTSFIEVACVRIESDLTLNESTPWVTANPSSTANGYFSMKYTATHEFGHMLGFADINEPEATMHLVYTGSGDIGGQARIAEDDFVGLRTMKPGTSTGTNLMIGKYSTTLQSPVTGSTLEVWTTTNTAEDNGIWTACPGDSISTFNGPQPINAYVTGSVSPVSSVVVRWTLSSDSACFSGTEYVVGTRTVTLGIGLTYETLPSSSWSIPSGTPAGNYYLCAKIDPDGAVTETSEADNVLRSEKLFEVASCG